MIALRCQLHMHGKYNPETGELEVKCRWCSKQQGRPVYHRWKLVEPVMHPIPEPAPVFVRWRVSAAGPI